MATNDGESETIVLPWWRSPLNLFLSACVVAMTALGIGYSLGGSASSLAHNDADTGFLQDMRIHHEQAVGMSMIYLEASTGGNPLLRLIAREIIFAQGVESGRMVQLLRLFDEAETNESDQAMSWMGTPVPLEKMPGLASDAEMKTLQKSRGAKADRIFATLMIAHHKGGLHMAEHVVTHGKNDEVRKMASSIVKAQSGEISELTELLAELAA